MEYVTRRTLVLSGVSVLIAPSRRIAAQPAQRVFRIGVLSPGTPPPGPLNALSQGLRELGYEDSRNLSIEWRFAGATDDRLRDLAEELNLRSAKALGVKMPDSILVRADKVLE